MSKNTDSTISSSKLRESEQHLGDELIEDQTMGENTTEKASPVSPLTVIFDPSHLVPASSLNLSPIVNTASSSYSLTSKPDAFASSLDIPSSQSDPQLQSQSQVQTSPQYQIQSLPQSRTQSPPRLRAQEQLQQSLPPTSPNFSLFSQLADLLPHSQPVTPSKEFFVASQTPHTPVWNSHWEDPVEELFRQQSLHTPRQRIKEEAGHVKQSTNSQNLLSSSLSSSPTVVSISTPHISPTHPPVSLDIILPDANPILRSTSAQTRPQLHPLLQPRLDSTNTRLPTQQAESTWDDVLRRTSGLGEKDSLDSLSSSFPSSEPPSDTFSDAYSSVHSDWSLDPKVTKLRFSQRKLRKNDMSTTTPATDTYSPGSTHSSFFHQENRARATGSDVKQSLIKIGANSHSTSNVRPVGDKPAIRQSWRQTKNGSSTAQIAQSRKESIVDAGVALESRNQVINSNSARGVGGRANVATDDASAGANGRNYGSIGHSYDTHSFSAPMATDTENTRGKASQTQYGYQSQLYPSYPANEDEDREITESTSTSASDAGWFSSIYKKSRESASDSSFFPKDQYASLRDRDDTPSRSITAP